MTDTYAIQALGFLAVDTCITFFTSFGATNAKQFEVLK